MIRQTHDNSLLAYLNLHKIRSRRYIEIVGALYTTGRPMTAREITDYWKSILPEREAERIEMNTYRPRINELKKMKVLKEVGDVRCPKTGKWVASFWFTDIPEALEVRYERNGQAAFV